MLQTLTQNVPTAVLELIRLSVWLTILTAVFVPLERLFALHPAKIFRPGIGADLGYFFLGGLVLAMVLSVPLSFVVWAARHVVPHPILSAIGDAPFWPRALAAFVVGEIGFYWGHRLMHSVPLLWRFHAIHHSPEHLDFLVNSRSHPIDLVFGRLCAFAPIYALGLGQPAGPSGNLVPALVTLAGTAWTFFVHANVGWRLGPLEWVIATPRFHHWHHAIDPANRNYASMLPVLDRIFGTSHLPKRQFPPRYGIQGVVPARWADQLIQPLLGSFPLPRVDPMIPAPAIAEISTGAEISAQG